MHFCILGCGKIAKMHAKILKKLEHFVLGKPTRISFASRDLEKAKHYKKKFKGDFTFGSYEEALCHKDVDVIVICTPNDSHKDLALKALENKKHVVIEKPLACTTTEADEIIRKAQEVNQLVLVAENHRYRPHIRYLEQVIQSGDLGVIKMIRMNVMRKHQLNDFEWRARPEQMGGGPFIDGGIHWVNALLTLGADEVTEIKAFEPPTTIENCPQEDSLALLCQFKNGIVGSLTYSWGIQGSFPLKFMAVHGSQGSIYVANSGMMGIRIKTIPYPIKLPIRDWRGYAAMWKNFLITLAHENKDVCLCPAEIGRRDLEFVERAYTSLPKKSAMVLSSPPKTKIA